MQAPEDYYFEFALMEEWGQYNRRQTGRQPHEVVRHPESAEPLIVAFESGEPLATLLGFVPYETLDVQEAKPEKRLPRVPISLQQEAARQVFDEKGIRVLHWRLQDGRLSGEQNVVLLSFIPRAFSDRAMMAEFMMICAIMYGAQTQADTIDVIRGIAEREDGAPLASLEVQTGNYKAYLNQEIDKQQWEERFRLRRF